MCNVFVYVFARTGVAIVSINPTAALAAAGGQPLDVLAAVGDAAVGNDGTVAFRGGSESINISYHISQFQVRGRAEVGLGHSSDIKLTERHAACGDLCV